MELMTENQSDTPEAAAESAEDFNTRERTDLFWVVWVVMAAFGSYFCMYGFRKPFTAGSFTDTTLWGIGFKTVLVTSQVAGYTLSKFIGIRVIAEMPPHRRAAVMLWLVLLAEAALILFGLLPRPWNAVCLFLNGLPLGMIFGLVQGFLEGRRLTELLTAGLCASFILADGVTKTVGTWLMKQGISEDWMPASAGGLYLLPFCVCVAMLARITPPTPQDVALRGSRAVMTRADRRSFIVRNAIGLIPLVLIYLVVTICRSIRADFAPEIWANLGTTIDSGTFTYSEMLVAFAVLAVNGGAVLIRDNRRAFFASLATCGLGLILLVAALLARSAGGISGFPFMVLLGLGLYLPYVAMHTTIFERMLGMTRERGNIGFLMYVADSIGYLGYVAVMVGRNYLPVSGNVLSILSIVAWTTVGLSFVCLLISWWYFASIRRARPPVAPAALSEANS